ncbi:MAG: transcriptional regulator [Planctomycetota bacterium]|nr:MAG: transcriptional regulator [Planctomycetota bacterium]
MISQTAEYALRAIVWLAGHPETSLGTPHIAAATHVPAGYMSKVLQALARSGLVVSQPGRRGGFQLTRPPSKISVLEVINSVDPIQRIHKCPLDLKSHGAKLCPLHRRLDEAMASVEDAFAGSTIEELISDPTRPTPLCESGVGLGQSLSGRAIGPQITRPGKGPGIRGNQE